MAQVRGYYYNVPCRHSEVSKSMDWSCSGWSFCHLGNELFTSIKAEVALNNQITIKLVKVDGVKLSGG